MISSPNQQTVMLSKKLRDRWKLMKTVGKKQRWIKIAIPDCLTSILRSRVASLPNIPLGSPSKDKAVREKWWSGFTKLVGGSGMDMAMHFKEGRLNKVWCATYALQRNEVLCLSNFNPIKNRSGECLWRPSDGVRGHWSIGIDHLVRGWCCTGESLWKGGHQGGLEWVLKVACFKGERYVLSMLWKEWSFLTCFVDLDKVFPFCYVPLLMLWIFIYVFFEAWCIVERRQPHKYYQSDETQKSSISQKLKISEKSVYPSVHPRVLLFLLLYKHHIVQRGDILQAFLVACKRPRK